MPKKVVRLSPVWVEIYENRIAQGLSLVELARRVGVSDMSLSRGERGLQDVSLLIVEKVLNELGCLLVVVPPDDN